jgi:hypothetical protein
MRVFPWIGHVTSCIAGKRSAKGPSVDAGQRRLSNCNDSREQPGEQNASASMRREPARLKIPPGPPRSGLGRAQRTGSQPPDRGTLSALRGSKVPRRAADVARVVRESRRTRKFPSAA